MFIKHTTMTTTPEALIITIPWRELALGLRPGAKKRGVRLSAEDVLRFVDEGRRAHAKGRTRLVRSLADI